MIDDNRPCKNLVEYYKMGGSKYVKSQIRKHEKIKNPNILEQWQLCQNYRGVCHIEGTEPEIYELCNKCGFNVTDEAVKAMHNSDYPYEIIWGNVYKKEVM